MNKSLMLALLATVECSACSSIYVGNVSFTETEVCSEEYSSRIKSTGCVPPAPAANAQTYFFKRFRQSVPEADEKKLDKLDQKKSISSSDNVVPSLIGQVFRAQWNSDRSAISVPETGGQLGLLPGELPGIPTEIVRMDLGGVIHKKTSVDMQLDTGILIEAAAKSSGLVLPPSLKNQLTLYFQHTKDVIDASSGSYYYVGVHPQALAKLTNDLKDQMQPQASSITVQNWLWGSSDKLDRLNGSSPELKLVNGNYTFKDEKKSGSKDDVFGIIVGAAIIRTRTGHSELCTSTDFANFKKTGVNEPLSSCGALKTLLEQASQGKPWEELSNTALVTPEVDKMPDADKANIQQATLLQALSLHYNKAQSSDKTLDVNNHTSLLAIQWLPIKLAP
ncbi:MAG: hypothetical protein HY849_09875 [Nitrosomonadales bacterium]|nr:hypothetical protein [Nitrosomonadales bacterium]